MQEYQQKFERFSKISLIETLVKISYYIHYLFNYLVFEMLESAKVDLWQFLEIYPLHD